MDGDNYEQIFRKKLTLSDHRGQRLEVTVQALEYANPYYLSILLMSSEYYVRMDVRKSELSAQLQRWMQGHLVADAALIASPKLEEAMTAFVKYGRPPAPSSLIVWILSRTVIVWENDRSEMIFGGGVVKSERESDVLQKSGSDYIENPFEKTAEAAINGGSMPFETSRPKSAPHFGKSDQNDFTNTFEVTRSLLGSSNALKKLEKTNLRARSGASSVFSTENWTNDHFRLVSEINKNRHIVEDDMEARRRLLELSKIRQDQTMNRFRKIRDKIVKHREAYNWASDASYEVMTLKKIQDDVEYDMKRQHCRSARAVQHIQWTMAPNGFVNRRGTSLRGPLIGQGPLPPNATSALKDPRVERTMTSYSWDVHGRRHKKKNFVDENSIMDKAMSAIRTAASNASLYKLDLKAVFDEIDISGDGHITIDEMANAFELMGVSLDDLTLDALFRHFDPNNSGSVRYGEFQWAFFNRRSMIKQWKMNTKGLTKRQIESKFRLADTSGNGRLNEREFKKLLISFGIKLSASDQDLLLRRFDIDGDGELDLREFVEFINSDISSGTAAVDGQVHGPKTDKGRSLTATVPYNAINEQLSSASHNYAPHLTVDALFEKQKELEKKLGAKYFNTASIDKT